MRAKFEVVSTIDTQVTQADGTPSKTGEQVTLLAVYGGTTNTEDNQFSEATPVGELTMYISNPKAFGFLQQGQKYYLDFTKAE